MTAFLLDFSLSIIHFFINNVMTHERNHVSQSDVYCMCICHRLSEVFIRIRGISIMSVHDISINYLNILMKVLFCILIY